MKTLALVFAMLAGPVLADACDPETAEVQLQNGSKLRFTVEVADTPEARSMGLMFREQMASSAGMLFIYERPQHAVFWMKNTLIPLDMIFADATGLVKTVHGNAVPKDESRIDGGEGVLAVLEINGGLAKRLGITPGAKIRHPGLDQSIAVWPCAQ